MMRKLKTLLVGLVPKRLSLPVRYHYNRLSGRLEPELALLRTWVRPGTRALDVGANIGFYAYALSRLAAQVESFEPVPACVDVLKSYGARNIRVHNVALSDRPGHAVLQIPRVGGRLATARAHLDVRVQEEAHDRLTVQLRTLDSYAFDNVSFLKIDVEGHEMGVLRGARETILRNKPVLLVEVEQRHMEGRPITEVFGFITEMGYTGSFLRWGQERPLPEFDVQRDQLSLIGRLETEGESVGYVNNFIFRPR